MFLVDTCGWIEWLTGGKLQAQFEPFLTKPDTLLVPTIIQFELYKWICRERDETMALNVIGITEKSNILPLDTNIALMAADIAKTHKLAMADAIIYASAQHLDAKIISSDQHFANLDDRVTYFKKS